jgi:hypothetical protein
LATVRVVPDGGVSTRPPVNEDGIVTAMLWLPMSGTTGWTTTVTGEKPVCRLQAALMGEDGVNFNAGKLVSVVFTVNVTSVTPPAEKAKDGVPPLVTPVQPLASPMVYESPAAWLVVLRVVTDGGVTTRPPVNEDGMVTTMVWPVVSVVAGFTVTVTAENPVCRLQAALMELMVLPLWLSASLLVACSALVPKANAANATHNLK